MSGVAVLHRCACRMPYPRSRTTCELNVEDGVMVKVRPPAQMICSIMPTTRESMVSPTSTLPPCRGGRRWQGCRVHGGGLGGTGLG